jgi:hypothetical protein
MRSVFLLLAVVTALVPNSQAAIPYIDIVSPPSIAAGLGPANFTIYGANFEPGATVDFAGQTVKPDALTPNLITFTVFPAELVQPKSAIVTVVNPAAVSSPAYLQVAGPAAQVALQQSALLQLNNNTLAIASADFNRDGKLDIAAIAGSISSAGISAFLGDGAGHFTLSAAIPVSDVSSLSIGDFNGDGIPDIATGCENGAVYILIGDGTGNFQPHLAANAGTGPIFRIYTGDFNGDGKLDLAIIDPIEGVALSILFGDGAGNLEPGYTLPSGPNQAATLAAVGDFNNDGRLDIAVALTTLIANQGTVIASHPVVTLLLGDGAGNFTPTTVPAGQPGMLIAGDFNGDGNLDLCAGVSSMLLGDGTGHFTSLTIPTVGISGQTSVIAGDFNGDGVLDLVFSSIQDEVAIYLGNGDGTFTPQPAPISVGNQGYLIGADFNNDGLLDLAIAASDPKQVQVELQTPRPMPGQTRYSVTQPCAPFSCYVLGNTGVVAGADVAWYPGTGLVNIFQVTGHHFYPNSVNRAGIIAGSMDSGTPALWVPQAAELLDLSALFGAGLGVVTHINDHNQISGFGPVAPGLVPGNPTTSVTAILDNGIVLGADRTNAFVYAPGVGLMHLFSRGGDIFDFFFNNAGEALITTPYPGSLFTPGTGTTMQPITELSPEFNILGQFVGYGFPITNQNYPDISLFTTTGGQMSISSLLPPASGWNPVPPYAINDVGQILVGASQSGGQMTTILLTPILPGASAASVPATSIGRSKIKEGLLKSRLVRPAESTTCLTLSPPLTLNSRAVCPQAAVTPSPPLAAPE